MKTVRSALEILETLASGHECLKLNTISEKCGLNKTTTYKILSDLAEYGYVEKTHNNSRYGIGSYILNIQERILQKTDLREIAKPHLEKLAKESEQTINLMMFIGNKGYYAEIINYPSNKKFSGDRIGDTDYLHATALGKAILAFLPLELAKEIIEKEKLKPVVSKTITDYEDFFKELKLSKERGFAIDDEESRPEARCVAAPIFNSYDEVTASVSISGFATKIPISRLFEYSTLVMKTAKEISAKL